MNKFDSKSTLIIVALELELPRHLLPGWNIIYSGVGKINASSSLCDSIQIYNPETVINFGSAGTLRQDLSGIHEVTRFIQRDMDATGLGFNLGQTPFEDGIAIELPRNGLTCGTGDQFVTTHPVLDSDLVDMEAFALAKICDQKGIDFYCFKFISDNADGDASIEWNKMLDKGGRQFAEIIQDQKKP